MTTAWAHLPNASLIDELLANLEAGKLDGIATWDATWNAARNATWNAARNATWNAARNAARNATWDAVWDAAWDATRDATRDAARAAARDAILALMAYDNYAYILTMPLGGVRLMVSIQHPAATLLYPYMLALGNS